MGMVLPLPGARYGVQEHVIVKASASTLGQDLSAYMKMLKILLPTGEGGSKAIGGAWRSWEM